MAGSFKKRHGVLYARFAFSDFTEALDFANKVGALAEKANHHPDITVGWGFAEVVLFTHSENAITQKDYALAEAIDKL